VEKPRHHLKASDVFSAVVVHLHNSEQLLFECALGKVQKAIIHELLFGGQGYFDGVLAFDHCHRQDTAQ